MSEANAGTRDASRYRERLSPSLWLLVSAALTGPMAALVFVPVDTTLALIAGALVAAGVVALLVATSPVLEVREGMLRAGRARIPVAFLGDAVVLTGEAARTARGPGLNPRSWHLLRGGIDPVAVFSVVDPDDPAPEWVLSSRTPDRLAAAVRRERSTQRTPRR